jgi:uncharacterized protein (TIGR03437 family)
MRLLFAVLITVCIFPAGGQPYTIRTAAGGGLQSMSAATPGGGGAGVVVDRAGNVFFVGSSNAAVWRLDASTSLLTRVAGNGMPGFGGDGGPAINAQMLAAGIALDSAGNLYIADAANNRVRKVSNGIIATVAGNGSFGFSGDNGPATGAQLNAPGGVAVDSSGNLYIADANNSRVRMVSNGVISTVAGNGTPFPGGDNGPATSASVSPSAVAFDAAGNLYIADISGRIRKVTNGTISTIAGSPGSGAPGSFGGDGGPATSAQLSQPRGIALDSSGNIYVADSANNRIRKIANGLINTIAGSGSTSGLGGFGGDNGPATSALLGAPSSVAVGPDGTLYIGDSNNSRVRKVSNGVISTLVGANSANDNGPATNIRAPQLAGVAVDSSGVLFFTDGQSRSIRKVSSGVITTVAGGGSLPDSFPAIGAQISGPNGVAVDSAGNLYISDNVSNSVRKVTKGFITTVAGTGTYGYSGDGGPATQAQLAFPSGIAVDSSGNVFISDTNNNRVRKLSNRIITTVAGTGFAPGFDGDGGPANLAQLNFPAGLALDAAGNLYIADGNRIRKVSNGVIGTVAGSTTPGFSGDGGPAISAQLNSASGIAVDPAGNLYIADAGNRRIRKVSGGMITTVAGDGSPMFNPDGSPATGGGLEFFLANQPFIGVAVDSAGNVFFTDAGRVRLLASSTACGVSARPGSLQAPASGGNLVISVQTDPACPWSIAGLPDWLTVASATPSGSGLVAVTLFATGSGSARTATIFAATTVIKVDQPAGSFGSASVTAVTNSGSNRGGPVAPGEIVVVYGSGIGPSQLVQFRPDSAGLVGTGLAGTQVFFNGIPSPIVYTSATQVAAIVPYGVSGVAQLTVTYAPTQGVAVATVPSTAAAPGVFTADSSGKGLAAALNLDGSVNSAANPARIGSFISLWVTGEGQTWPAGLDGRLASDPLPQPLLPVGVTIGGKSANLSYAGGAPGLVAGVMQINAQIPTGITAGNSVPVMIQVGGILAQAEITIAVAN